MHPIPLFARCPTRRAIAPQEDNPMFRPIAAAALACMAFTSVVPADAHVCRNSHGHRFGCHKVFAPRINLKARHPIKIQRCRGHSGRFNNC
jgi:hypothetical protein